MAYFDMRQPRSSNRTTALGILLGVVFIYFLYSIHNTSIDQSELRLRVQTSAAENPLSPPTSAFRKQSNAQNARGVRRPPPVVHYQLNNLTASAYPTQKHEKVLILTPLARFYPGYWANLMALSYPHEHISLGFITPKTKEGNAATAALQEAIRETQSGPDELRFQSVTILRQDFEPPLTSQDEKERHKMENQKVRRASMARARNSLLFTTIGPHTSWVLWLDGDVVESPPTMIQDLASHDKAVIAPSCMQRFVNDEGEEDIRPYDFNTWRDSDVAQELASKMGPDDVLLEGYAEMATYRTLMTKLAKMEKDRDERRLMPLDGVGGTALLVKAEVHRDGAMFPAFPFYHLIETEGFAKMAKRLGFEIWGLPDYFVYHYNE
ncbi:mannan polymerase complexes MNN9 subunit [Cladophialophora psammophila CBS 110553]|uniref:Mannan polymerase complexes MNN9 subunit n=1 Tax=Cladophialophora psammophila CBS 110553 TaxID=1182543 RepID=W9XQX1_9EURO|nr:mannan polymerase complexes MNN9 subunit [Cladophialophora psammophila CBS 110553]EXJ72729.1 mannan polymerase complexes MNN9 subunit [Cladophialophora psammophila CBS 110553]